MPMHGGCIYIKFHLVEKPCEPIPRVSSVQVGCDYHHCDDGQYTYCDGPWQSSVLRDAEELFEWLDLSAKRGEE